MSKYIHCAVKATHTCNMGSLHMLIKQAETDLPDVYDSMSGNPAQVGWSSAELFHLQSAAQLYLLLYFLPAQKLPVVVSVSVFLTSQVFVQ